MAVTVVRRLPSFIRAPREGPDRGPIHYSIGAGRGPPAASPARDEEQPAEREERAPVGTRRVRAVHAARVLGEEAAPLRLGERLEEGAEGGALRPLDDGVGALEDLEILRLPEVELGGE